MLNMEYKIQFTEKCLEDIEDACQYIKEKLKEGDTAIAYLPGHYGTIVDYNAKKDKYFL